MLFMIPPLTDRISLLELVNNRFASPVIVEIGIAGGHFTKQIVATVRGLESLHCIDPWKHFETGYEDACNLSQAEQDERYRQFCKDVEDDYRIIPVRAMSHDAAAITDPDTIDFIYLDANHSFDAVMRDLTCWWPNLKSGGIFAGHDYLKGNGKGYAVRDAVDAFASERGIKVHQTMHEYCRPSGVYGPGWEGCSFAFEKP
jgi:hypothetical protein